MSEQAASTTKTTSWWYIVFHLSTEILWFYMLVTPPIGFAVIMYFVVAAMIVATHPQTGKSSTEPWVAAIAAALWLPGFFVISLYEIARKVRGP